MSDRLSNPSLELTPSYLREWSARHLVCAWIVILAGGPAFAITSGMLADGMTWSHALLTVFTGAALILLPMLAMGHAGTKLGVTHPVLLRASFGTAGAHIPVLIRALLGCAWFGIQSWIGGAAIFRILVAVSLLEPPPPDVSLSVAQFSCFFIFWSVSVGLLMFGTNALKWTALIGAPLLLLAGGVLVGWALLKTDGWASIIGTLPNGTAASFQTSFPTNVALIAGLWGVIAITIPDFTRHVEMQRQQAGGQTLGLVLGLVGVASVGLVAAGATGAIFGEPIWSTDRILATMTLPVPLTLGLSLIVLAAMLATNLGAFGVSAAIGFSSLAPDKLCEKTGALIVGVLGMLVMPWRLANAESLLPVMSALGALTAPILAIMLCDYLVMRRTRIDGDHLFDESGPHKGFNRRALIAGGLGLATLLPGLTHTLLGRTHAGWARVTGAAEQLGVTTDRIPLAQKAGDIPAGSAPIFPALVDDLFPYAWLIAGAVSAIAYAALMLGRAAPAVHATSLEQHEDASETARAA